jgi:hypothetical protein
MTNKVRNTTKTDNHFEWCLGGNPRAIENQEAVGQQELVESDILPVDGSEGLEKIGFQLGDVIEDDPLFRYVKFPEGWTKRPAPDHSMWSYVYDERGCERLSVFYKAAFYDRKAHTHVTPRYTVDYIDVTDRTNVGHQVVDRATDKVLFGSADGPKEEGEPDWKTANRNQDRCTAWLKDNFPEYQDPFAYWE